MQDLVERLDAELRHAPPPGFDIPGTLTSGRRAVRRRRLAVGVAGLATAVVVGGTATLALDGGGTRAGRDDHVAGTPTPTAAATSASTEVAPGGWEADTLMIVGEDGSITLNPDAEVIERADYTSANGEPAEIFHLALGGREFYAVADRAGYSSVPLPAQGLTLPEWAEQQLTLDSGAAAGDRSWVRIDGRSRVTARPGVEVVAWRPDPGLGEAFAAPGTPTAVAHVVRDGLTYFLAVRRLAGGGTEAIPYRKDDQVTSLDSFLAFARERYATDDAGGSEGLR